MTRRLETRDPLSPDRWQDIQDLLADAIDCPAPERGALLDVRCAGDPSLRQEVESLLIAHEREGVVDRLTSLLEPASAWVRKPLADWPGRRVAQYLVQESIGSGGMAVVFRARDERLGRQVALKFLSPYLSADPGAKSRFVTEARTAAALDHPNVCTIYEIGEADDGQLFIAMPLYDGETLQARLQRGRLTFDDALPLALQIARGLEHAHAEGVVHRDIKPSNIVILPDGTAKIVDFGIARILDASLVDPHTTVGTAAYMSPEQAGGAPIDCRSDIWSFGIVLHEVLAGVRPFHGDDGRAVVEAVLRRDPDLTATSYPDVPAGIDRILRRALAKAPDDRYASMSVMAAELSALTADARGGDSRRDVETAPRVSTTERRRAAVLVTIVSDYPSLIDQMAPIDAHRLLARVRDVSVDVVREHGGIVNQAIGDQIVSLFGVPVAHEDDDLRAVRAALELRTRVRAVAQTQCPAPVTLRVQSGLHVGAIVAQRLHDGPRRYDVVGVPAAVASRLAVLAGPDEIWVGPDTQRLIAPYMQTAPASPVRLASHTGAVTPFRVLGETGIATRLEASSRAGLTPYVGRQSELAFVQSHVAHARTGVGSMVAVVGEAGAGKSRLLYELQESLDTAPGGRVLQARCRAYGDGVPYGVFVQILCAALALRPPLAGADVAARIRAIDPALERFLPLFLHLLAVHSDVPVLPRHLRGEQLEAALLDALAAFVEALTHREPLVLLIEDWHWADTASRAALTRVAELVTAAPLVLIVTSRTDDSGRDHWPGHTLLVELGRLGYAASASIVQAVLGVRRVSDALARRLVDRAGGNPFFLEQMCVALLEQHTVMVRDGDALVEGGEGALVLPDTVQGVIRARLDKLDLPALEVARVASVIGREFDYALLVEVAPPSVDLRPAIDALEAAGLIERAAVAPTIRCRFTHALTQEVCYDSLVGHQRKALHGAIGHALASAWADRLDEGAALLAGHFAQAEDWPAAIRFGRRATERAIALNQFGDALALLDRLLGWAFRLPDGESRLIADLLLQQERVCETLGLRARQQQIIDSLITHLSRAGDSARLAEVYLRQGDLWTLLRRFDAADQALATALRLGHDRGDTTVLRSLGLLRWHEGRHAEALVIAQRILAVDRECHDDLAVAIDLTNLGGILRAIGDYPQARERLEEALAMPALLHDPRKLVYTRHQLANVHRAMGELDRALEVLVENDEMTRVHLLPIQRSFHLTSIAHILLQQGRIDAAVETYRTAVELSRRARHAEGLVQSLRMLGNVLLGLERYEDAFPCLQEAAELFVQRADRVSEAEMRSGIARILERTSPHEAVGAWTVALALQPSRGDSRGDLDAREGLARATRASGGAGAIPAFESALALAVTIGERSRELAIRNTLGILQWESGDYGAALRHYEAARALVRALENPADEVVILNGLGASLTKLGRLEEARAVLEESLALSREVGLGQLEAHALTALGQLSLDANEPDAAAAWFEASRTVRQAVGDRAGEGWMYLRLAQARHRIGDIAGAREAVSAAEAAAAEAHDDRLSGACEAARTTSDELSGGSDHAAFHHRTIRSGSHP